MCWFVFVYVSELVCVCACLSLLDVCVGSCVCLWARVHVCVYVCVCVCAFMESVPVVGIALFQLLLLEWLCSTSVRYCLSGLPVERSHFIAIWAEEEGWAITAPGL